MASDRTIHQQDINSLTKKLKAFSEGLPAQEQGVLDWMLARAENASEHELSDKSLEDVAGGATGDTVARPRPRVAVPARFPAQAGDPQPRRGGYR
jgi:hypothetical protein